MRLVNSLSIICLSFIIIFSCDKSTTGPGLAPVAVTFTDANFETLIRETLNKPTGDIFNNECLTITKLDGEEKEIGDITGIENCTNLDTLDLSKNDITDISALSGLIKLIELDLSENDIIDISAISGLIKLTKLDLSWNDITDIQVLANLINLVGVYISGNEIVDISSLSGLVKLRSVFISYNLITDISPLVNNTGIDNGDFVSLTSNPLSETSINTYIPQLEARGVTVSNLGKY